jgi:nucleoside triphosphate diphosphatase
MAPPPDQPPRKTMADLLAVMAALRTPVTGCPWDLEQTFETIAPYTIEEAYEVHDAIERGDRRELRDELGDLLLQVVYHARIAEEERAFDFADVVDAVTNKMIRRHPHVFGDEKERAATLQTGWWEKIKAEEKAAKRGNGAETPVAPASLLADVPLALPALTRATKLQAKAARVGFDWPSLAPVFAKMREELSELEEIAAPADPRGPSAPASPVDPRIAEELGDLLFVVANVARHLAIDPETALRSANTKFTRRFAHIEARLAAQGKQPADSTLEEMDALWDEAKAREKGG